MMNKQSTATTGVVLPSFHAVLGGNRNRRGNDHNSDDDDDDNDDDWKGAKKGRRRLVRWWYSFYARKRRTTRRRGRLTTKIFITCGIIILFFLLFSFFRSTTHFFTNPKSLPLRQQKDQNVETAPQPLLRILYIVTSSVEYDSVAIRNHDQHNTTTTTTGISSSTTKQQHQQLQPKRKRDRFMEILIPVVKSSVESIMMSMSKTTIVDDPDDLDVVVVVDVYLVLGYKLSLERLQELRNVLPRSSGIEVWNDSTPIYYEFSTTKTTSSKTSNKRVPYLGKMQRTLARQHRFVVKDKLPYYDMILAMEDDMLVTHKHVSYHLKFRQEQYRWIRYQQQLRQLQQQQQQQEKLSTSTAAFLWWDDLSIEQWKRMYPAWIRVEVEQQQLNVGKEVQVGKENSKDESRRHYDDSNPTPLNNGGEDQDLTMCCNHFHHGGRGDSGDSGGSISNRTVMTGEQLVIWETGIAGLSARKLPSTTAIEDTTQELGDLKDNNNRPSLLSILADFGVFGSLSSSSGSSHLAVEAITTNNTILSPSTWVALIDPSSAVDAATVSLSHKTSISRTRRYTLAGYWSGSDGGTTKQHFDKPPSSRENHFFANPAGWIATSKEIYDWHSEFCPSNTFLPPFGSAWKKGSSSLHRGNGGGGGTSMMLKDGMDSASDYVEYWSGGMQLFGQAVCGIQRFVNIDQFAQHLLYHTANNKQHDLPSDRFVKSTTLLDQLNDMRLAAEEDYLKRINSSD